VLSFAKGKRSRRPEGGREMGGGKAPQKYSVDQEHPSGAVSPSGPTSEVKGHEGREGLAQEDQ